MSVFSTGKAASYKFEYWMHKRLFGFGAQLLCVIPKLLDTSLAPATSSLSTESYNCSPTAAVRAAPEATLVWILPRKGYGKEYGRNATESVPVWEKLNCLLLCRGKPQL